MPVFHVTDRDGGEHTINGEDGLTLLEVLRDEGDFGIAAICGGVKACATCHVYIPEEWAAKLPEQDADEIELLDISFNYKPGISRLSCQIRVTDDLDGMRLTVAPED